LFFDTLTRKAHWLLPSHDRVITSFAFLTDPPESPPEDQKTETIGLLVELQEKGAEGDPVRQGLHLTGPDGRSLTPVAEKTQGLLGHRHVRRDSLLVFYVRDGSARVLDVDPTARTVRSDSPLETSD
jgi:hypothetical protein